MTAGFDTFRGSSRKAMELVECLVTNDYAVQGCSTPSVSGLVKSVHFGLLWDVSAGVQKEICVSPCVARSCQTVRGSSLVSMTSISRAEAAITYQVDSARPGCSIVRSAFVELAVSIAGRCVLVFDTRASRFQMGISHVEV